MSNPHLFLLTRALRQRTLVAANSQSMLSAVRGGGGGFHKPDPQPWHERPSTRVVALEDTNTILYHDTNPEFHLHLHAMWVQNSKQGWALIWIKVLFFITPCLLLAAYSHSIAGSNLTPSVRPGKDHAHMGPRIIYNLKAKNYEDGEDFLKRRNAMFYRNFCRQVNDFNYKPEFVGLMETHGFKF